MQFLDIFRLVYLTYWFHYLY